MWMFSGRYVVYRVLSGSARTIQSLEAKDLHMADDFSMLGVQSFICAALKKIGITGPTNIQRAALPVTLTKGNNCIIHSETGSGKSLAFLIPSLQDPHPTLTSLVLTPTRELATQLYHQTLALNCNNKKKKRILLLVSGNTDENDNVEFEETRPHLIIGTPKKVLETFEGSSEPFKHLQRIVIDEADKVLSPLHKRATKKERLIRDLHPRPASILLKKVLALSPTRRIQLIAASATVDGELQKELQQLGWGPSAELLSTMERPLVVPRTIKHTCIDCSSVDKLSALVKHFNNSKEKSTLAFIHRGAPITEFVQALKQRGLKAAALYNTIGDQTHYTQFLSCFRQGDIQVAVGTEETVRGLDFSWLETVYILEPPRTAIEYLHLCGRVGRAGRSGRAVVFVDSVQERNRIKLHYSRLSLTADDIIA